MLFFARREKTTHKDEKCAIRHALRHVQGNLRTNGSFSGVLALFLAGAQALAPIGAGALYAGFGSYVPVIWILAALSLISVAAVAQARVHGWPKFAVE